MLTTFQEKNKLQDGTFKFLMITRYVYGTLIGESITRDTKVWYLCMLDSIA